MEQPKESWEEIFERKFNDIEGEDFQGWIVDENGKYYDWDTDRTGLREVKQFIQDTLDQQKKHYEEKIKVFPIHPNSVTHHNAIISLIKSE